MPPPSPGGLRDATFVLIPGLLSDARVWSPLAAALTGPVHEADLRDEASIPAMAAGLLAKTRGRVVPVGHSMGGRVAMEMARQAPERVAALVLCSTGRHPRRENEMPSRRAMIALGHEDMGALADRWLPPMLAAGRHADGEIMASLRDMLLGFDARTHERQIMALADRPDASLALKAIGCPILLLVGEEDRWSPVAQHREIASLAPRARLRVIEKAGHFLPVERPQETVNAVLEWLAQVQMEETVDG